MSRFQSHFFSVLCFHDSEQIDTIIFTTAVQMKSNIPLTKSDSLITLTFGHLSHDLFWNVQICFTEYDQSFYYQNKN